LSKHLLLADDDPLSLKLLTEILGIQGYRVSKAVNGQDALALLAAHHFDAVVTDLHMPNGDGRALLRGIQAAGRDIPVFMVTIDHDALTAAERKGVHLMPKPVSIHQLVAAIGEALA